jgi:two-component system OmpR family sensor kinase
MRLASLQGRLAAAIGLGLTVVWIVTALITAQILLGEMDEVSDSALQETAQRVLPLAVVDIIAREEEGISQRIAALQSHEELFTYVVRDDQGRILLQSHAADAAHFPPYRATGFDRTQTHRLYYDAAMQGKITIAIAEPLAHRDETERETLMALALPLLVLIPLSLIGSIVLVRRTLRPVRDFSAALATRGGGDLSPVLAGPLPDELSPMAQAVNQLLARLRRTLEAERSFTANAAHELRTPVAAALAQTQRLMVETTGTAAAQRAADIEASLRRLNRMSEKLMQLARAEGGRMRAEVAQDMRLVLRLVVDDFASARDRLTLRMDGPVLSDIDADAFAILARNLIENALKHSPAGSAVQVTLAQGALRVVNGGPAISPDVLNGLTARFARGATDSEGSGLGLSIARAIAEGSTGRLNLLSPAVGRSDGFEAVFALPLRRGA